MKCNDSKETHHKFDDLKGLSKSKKKSCAKEIDDIVYEVHSKSDSQ